MTAETERMPWLTIRLIFGNGNAAQGRKCIEAIARRLIHARTKHPSSEWSGRGEEYGLEAIEGEVKELRHDLLGRLPGSCRNHSQSDEEYQHETHLGQKSHGVNFRKGNWLGK